MHSAALGIIFAARHNKSPKSGGHTLLVDSPGRPGGGNPNIVPFGGVSVVPSGPSGGGTELAPVPYAAAGKGMKKSQSSGDFLFHLVHELLLA